MCSLPGHTLVLWSFSPCIWVAHAWRSLQFSLTISLLPRSREPFKRLFKRNYLSLNQLLDSSIWRQQLGIRTNKFSFAAECLISLCQICKKLDHCLDKKCITDLTFVLVCLLKLSSSKSNFFPWIGMYSSLWRWWRFHKGWIYENPCLKLSCINTLCLLVVCFCKAFVFNRRMYSVGRRVFFWHGLTPPVLMEEVTAGYLLGSLTNLAALLWAWFKHFVNLVIKIG